MKNELRFNQVNQLRVLNIVFSMFKYGVDDEDKKLFVLSSTVFKNLYDSNYKSYIDSMQPFSTGNIDMEEYIEDNPQSFEIMQHYLTECKKGISYLDDFSWNDLDENAKRSCILNLSSPYLIKEETILNLLKQ